jgi:hypothetical protein
MSVSQAVVLLFRYKLIFKLSLTLIILILALSAYAYFTAAQRHAIKEANPEASFGDITSYH